MSPTAYYLAWLAAGLAAAALASAALTRWLHRRAMRLMQAARLLDALARYCGWIAAQRRAYFFDGGARGDEPALHEARAIQREWFPERAEDMAQLLDVHARMIDFLWAQQALRLRDAEAWLESDHEARYAQLWHAHASAAATFAERLTLSGAVGAEPIAHAASPA